jgi:hypothetical protein
MAVAAESLKPAALTLSPLSPNTLRILVLVEASNKSSNNHLIKPFTLGGILPRGKCARL